MGKLMGLQTGEKKENGKFHGKKTPSLLGEVVFFVQKKKKRARKKTKTGKIV